MGIVDIRNNILHSVIGLWHECAGVAKARRCIHFRKNQVVDGMTLY